MVKFLSLKIQSRKHLLSLNQIKENETLLLFLLKNSC
jgi:hypothetical protein